MYANDIALPHHSSSRQGIAYKGERMQLLYKWPVIQNLSAALPYLDKDQMYPYSVSHRCQPVMNAEKLKAMFHVIECYDECMHKWLRVTILKNAYDNAARLTSIPKGLINCC